MNTAGDTKISFDNISSDAEVSNKNKEEFNMSEKSPELKSVWSLGYYQQFFEVTTDQVLARVTWSMLPKPGVNFYRQFIQSNPDLYGPFWICLTLVFTVAIGGNLGNYLHASSDTVYKWKYDFHLLTFVATTVFSYTWILPLLLWGTLKWHSSDQVTLSYLDLTCVYGYCLTIFIPISILWIIQINWLQWLLVIVGASLSGTVLLKSIMPMIGMKNYIFMIFISCLHFLLSLSLMWNFFHRFDDKEIITEKTIVHI